MVVKEKLGEGMAKRPVHFIWLTDCSGSMAGEKMESLNQAIKEFIPYLRQVADEHPFTEVLVRAIKFSDTATWHIAQPLPLEQFQWTDLKAGGTRRTMGKALRLVAEALKVEKMAKRGFPPVIVLVSDGQPTDDFKGGLNQLMQEPWGKKAVRIAIAIGTDADRDVLQQFIGHSEYGPLEANNPDALAGMIKWAEVSIM